MYGTHIALRFNLPRSLWEALRRLGLSRAPSRRCSILIPMYKLLLNPKFNFWRPQLSLRSRSHRSFPSAPAAGFALKPTNFPLALITKSCIFPARSATRSFRINWIVNKIKRRAFQSLHFFICRGDACVWVDAASVVCPLSQDPNPIPIWIRAMFSFRIDCFSSLSLNALCLLRLILERENRRLISSASFVYVS